MERIYLETLGCSKNQVDSEKMLFIIKEAGFDIVESPDNAEIIIINTCGFIKSAKEESINVILELAEYKKIGHCKKLIVAGCLSQYYPNELISEMPEVDAVFGIGNLKNIVEVIKGNEKIWIDDYSANEFKERELLSTKGSAFLKISDGCSNNCSYCLIPKIRGEHRSRKIDDILLEVEYLNKKGIKELNIIAQDTTNYGIDIYNKRTLTKLLFEIDKVVLNDAWVRVLYMHPDHLDFTDIDELTKLKRFLPYFDLPFQSGSDHILNLMNRKKRSEEYLALINYIRDSFENPVFRSTFITGFPQEKEEHFKETLLFLEKANLDWVGGFTYSHEADTIAGSMKGQIKTSIKKERLERLLDLSEDICRKRITRFLDKVETAFIEEKIDGESLYFARIWAQAPDVDSITLVRGDNLIPGSFVKVKITKINDRDFFSVLV